jgi:molecular chaperone GrpE
MSQDDWFRNGRRNYMPYGGDAARPELEEMRRSLTALREQAEAAEAARLRHEEELAALKAHLETQEKALAEARQDHLRAVAEAENVRKRLQREMEGVRLTERDRVVRAWLEAVDSVDRALLMGGDDPQSWRAGVEGIHRQMLDVLRRHDIEPMTPLDQPFDPHRHEAIGAILAPGKPPGAVAAVQRAGYQARDGAIVRPALVIVVQET